MEGKEKQHVLQDIGEITKLENSHLNVIIT